MPKWSGKTRGGLTGYKISVKAIKKIGLPLSYFFLRFVIVYFLFTAPKSVKSAYFYFRKIHKYHFFKSLIAIYGNFFVFGQCLLDKIAVMSNSQKKLSFIYEGEEYLHRMAEEKTGGMLVSAHIGSFEIAGYLLKRVSTRVNILMFEAEHENIKQYLDTVYQNMNVNIIAIKEDMSHIYEIGKAFENKEFLCLHGDRFLDGNKTLSLPFMGRNACFPAGPFYLATKFNIPVSFVFAMKESKYQYHFYASKPEYFYMEKLNLKKREEVIKEILSAYICSLEIMLKKYPRQWFNFYYFWAEK